MTDFMRSIQPAAWACVAVCLSLASCDWMPGHPNPANKWKPATSITDFTTLFRQNCIACHSDGSTLSPSLPMNNATYLSVVPEARLREIISAGLPGTLMPAFALRNGGMLTDEQVDILTKGILAWKSPDAPPSNTLPPYEATGGDATLGAAVFGAHCASCHGADGKGGPKGKSVTDPAYLALVSDQYLRTVVISGRPDFGMPDFRGESGTPMSAADISNVVAWLASQRRAVSGEQSVFSLQESQSPQDAGNPVPNE